MLAALPALVGDQRQADSSKSKKRPKTVKEFREREDRIAEIMLSSTAEFWESDRQRVLRILERC